MSGVSEKHRSFSFVCDHRKLLPFKSEAGTLSSADESCGVLNYLAAHPGTGPGPGHRQFQALGNNIDMVKLLFVDPNATGPYNQSLDPAIAFNTLCFTVE